MNVLQHELSCINALLASKKLEMKVGIINLISLGGWYNYVRLLSDIIFLSFRKD